MRPHNPPKTNIAIHKTFFSALVLESFIIFFALAFQPSAIPKRVFWLYSAPRLLELFAVATLFLCTAWILYKLLSPHWVEKLQKTVLNPLMSERLIFGGIFFSLASPLILVLLQSFAENEELIYAIGYANHIRPLSFLLSLIGLQTVLWIFFLNRKRLPELFGIGKKNTAFAVTMWGVMGVVTLANLLFEQKGETPPFYSPISEWEVLLAWALITILIFSSESSRLSEKRVLFIAIMVGLSAFLFQTTLQSIMRPYAKDAFYFQEWSSETMMQAVSLRDLKEEPLKTLNNIHTKPPGFAVIRAILIRLWPASDIYRLLLHVDFLLYKLWILLYSTLGGLVFWWLAQLTDTKFAILATFFLLLHPAMLLYATLLDTNFLTAFLVFILYYSLWKAKQNADISVSAIILLTLSLFLTRAIFQLPFLFVVGASLFLLKIPKRKIFFFVAVSTLLIGGYGVKQYQKFEILSTSSFTGLNLNRSVGNPNFTDYWSLDLKLDESDASLPKTLTRSKKVDGSTNYNHIQYLKYNDLLIQEFKIYISSVPIPELLSSYKKNFQIYFEPSSIYHTKHAIVDHIFWKSIYDEIFSYPILNILLTLFGILWLTNLIKDKDYLPSIGFILPGLYVFFVTVLFERGENMRFKFFLEPVIFIFLASQLYTLRQKFSKKSNHSEYQSKKP